MRCYKVSLPHVQSIGIMLIEAERVQSKEFILILMITKDVLITLNLANSKKHKRTSLIIVVLSSNVNFGGFPPSLIFPLC